MNKKILLLSLLSLSCVVSCHPNTSSDTATDTATPQPSISYEPEPVNTYQVTFHLGEENPVIHLEEGESIENSLDADTRALIEESTSLANADFDGFYKSQEASYTGEEDQKVDLTSPVTSNLDLYPSFLYFDYDEEMEEEISFYLGTYQKAGISPLPYLKSRVEPTMKNDDTLTYTYVDEEAYQAYIAELLEDGFKEASDGSYLDPKEAYLVSLNYDDTADTLEVSYAFNDVENEFPANYVSSMFFMVDSRYGLYEGNFTLADNILERDEKKFITYTNYGGFTDPYVIKHVYYQPKADDEDPVYSFFNYLNSSGVCSVSTGTNAFGQTVYQAYDTSYSVEVTADLVTAPSNDEAALGVTSGMMELQFIDESTSSLDSQLLANAYKQITGYNYDEGAYGSFVGPKIYGSLLQATYGNYPCVAYYSGGFTEFDLEDYLSELDELGYTCTTSELTNYKQFRLVSPTGDYGMILRYYTPENNSVIFTNVLLTYLYHDVNVYDDLADWFTANNRGGGEIENLPEFPEGVNVSTGYLTSGGTQVGSTHYLSASGMTAADVEVYKQALVATGDWTLSSETADGVDSIYDSADGYYQIYLIYSGNTLTVQIYYNTAKEASSASEIYSIIAPRLGTPSDFTIPDLEELVKDKTVTVTQFYNIRDERACIMIPYADADEVASKHAELVSALEATTNWRYVGTDTSGTIEFYQDSESSIYLYVVEHETELYIYLYSEI